MRGNRRLHQGTALIALCGLILCGVGGAWADPTSPDLSPSWVRDLGVFIQTVGTSGTLALLIAAGFVVLLYKTYTPTLNAAREDREERDLERREREKERVERESITQKMLTLVESGQEHERTFGEYLKQTGLILSALETEQNAEIGRAKIITDINTHTDGATQPVAQNLDTVIKSLSALRDDVSQLATREEVKNMVSERVRDMITTLRTVQEESSPHLPLPETAADSSTHLPS